MAEMGRPKGESKINQIELIQLRREGKSIAKCAAHFGVGESAIKGALRRIDKKLADVPVIQDDVGSENIDAMKQLHDINVTIVDQLHKCDRLFIREEKKLKEYDELTKQLSLTPNDEKLISRLEHLASSNLKSTLRIQGGVIAVSGEIRKQIELQLKIAEAMYNIQMMAEFQSEMVTLLKEVDPIVAQRFVTKLKERRTIRGLVKLNPI